MESATSCTARCTASPASRTGTITTSLPGAADVRQLADRRCRRPVRRSGRGPGCGRRPAGTPSAASRSAKTRPGPGRPQQAGVAAEHQPGAVRHRLDERGGLLHVQLRGVQHHEQVELQRAVRGRGPGPRRRTSSPATVTAAAPPSSPNAAASRRRPCSVCAAATARSPAARAAATSATGSARAASPPVCSHQAAVRHRPDQRGGGRRPAAAAAASQSTAVRPVSSSPASACSRSKVLSSRSRPSARLSSASAWRSRASRMSAGGPSSSSGSAGRAPGAASRSSLEDHHLPVLPTALRSACRRRPAPPGRPAHRSAPTDSSAVWPRSRRRGPAASRPAPGRAARRPGPHCAPSRRGRSRRPARGARRAATSTDHGSSPSSSPARSPSVPTASRASDSGAPPRGQHRAGRLDRFGRQRRDGARPVAPPARSRPAAAASSCTGAGGAGRDGRGAGSPSRRSIARTASASRSSSEVCPAAPGVGRPSPARVVHSVLQSWSG